MSRKMKTVVISYAAAAAVAFGVYLYIGGANLADYRLAAGYSSARAYEETVYAVRALSAALDKSVYATDGGMCGRICGEVYANAMAAETAMATLPFSTQELEQISAFVNIAGDYSYALMGEAAESGFADEQIKALTEMSETADGLLQALLELQNSLNAGDVIMDSRELRLENVAGDETEKLSERLLGYEQSFQPLSALSYDGKYGKTEQSERGELGEEEMRTLAAEYAGVAESELREEADYRGESGQRCYSVGETYICVSPAGVQSLAQSRLVSGESVSEERARQTAEDYLAARGFEGLKLAESEKAGAILRLRYAGTEGGALCDDNCLSIAVALDDGSIYSFNASQYSAVKTEAEWKLTEEEAAAKLPESLTPAGSAKVIKKSAGGRAVPCYKFDCADGNGRRVTIYVAADTGAQWDIVLG